MQKKIGFGAAAALGALALCSVTAQSASAGELYFNYTETNGIHFSFDQSSNPTPLSYDSGTSTQVPVTGWAGNVGPYSSIIWFATSDSGMFDTADESYIVVGPQVYTGSESAPMFAPGVFTGTDESDGDLTGTLTVSSVPEASSLALMLLGLAGVAFGVLQRRRKVLT